MNSRLVSVRVPFLTFCLALSVLGAWDDALRYWEGVDSDVMYIHAHTVISLFFVVEMFLDGTRCMKICYANIIHFSPPNIWLFEWKHERVVCTAGQR